MSAMQRNNGRNEVPPSMPVKRPAGTAFGGGGQRSEMNNKFSIKPQPIVKLHTDAGSDSEDGGRIEREYEELLTFEDERREQRLLKALSGIAAKAKQKIQTISQETKTATIAPLIVNNDHHHEVAAKAPYPNLYRNTERQTSHEKSDDRRSASYQNDDYSPRSRQFVRKSRKDEDDSSKKAKAP